MDKKRTIFMGTPEFAVPSLEALIKGKNEVVAVYTKPDRQSGRGKNITMSPVKECALRHGIEIIQPETLREKGIIEGIAAYRPEIIVVAAYGKLIPKEILEIPKFGCINVHPSLLPKYRGSSPIQTAILHGDEMTGVTIMLLDEGMDSGPILSQEQVHIDMEDTGGTLSEKLANVSAILLEKTINEWVEGNKKVQPQDERKASYTNTINKDDGKIDWNTTAREIWLRIRAFNPWPGSYTTWKGKKLRIESALPLEDKGGGKTGMIIEIAKESKRSVGVICGKDILSIRNIQMEGKKKMTAEEFIRGQRNFIGSILE